MLSGINNCNIYIKGNGIIESSISFSNGAIKSFNEDSNNIVLPENSILLPGFFDKHSHGVNGSDFMGSFTDLENICRSKLKEGVTSILATTITADINETKKAVDNIVKFINTHELGSMIQGIHLEGPFINSSKKGAQPEAYIYKGTIDNFNQIVGDNIKYIKQITLAPEVCDSDFIKYLNKNNICISVGHSIATYDELCEAENLGVTSVTHMFNAMHNLHHREIGLVGFGLYNDVYTEVISDFIHVSEHTLKLLYKNKGRDKICLITDSMEGSQLGDGVFSLGGQEVVVDKNEARLKDGVLAGSVLQMNQAFKNMYNLLNVPMEYISDMCSRNVAECLKINSLGSIDINNTANLTILDKELNVIGVILNAKLVYKNF